MKKYYAGIFIFAIISSLLFAISVSYLLPAEEPIVIEQYVEKAKVPKITASTFIYKFGKSTDSLVTLEDKVKRNETFLEILNKYNIAKADARLILEKCKDVYDFRKIATGTPYTVYQTPDSVSKTKYIVYQANRLETIIFKLEDSITVAKEVKDLQVTEKSISGVIRSSLYESLLEQNAPGELAYELSKMFATRVDFFKIQEGDNFKIIYDEMSVEGDPIGIDKIHSASFDHNGQTYYAINFQQDGKDQYYDEKGQNMKQGFLKAPLKYFRITSRFSKRRFHPVQKMFKAHLGTDYAAPTGTPILAVGNGTIVEAKYSRFNGNYVKIKHNDTYSTQYLHMSKIAKGMKAGKKVTQGQVIGYVGSTGLATGPHVCYRFWKNGKQVDPSSVKGTFSEPLPKSKLAEFNKLKGDMMKKLENIKS